MRSVGLLSAFLLVGCPSKEKDGTPKDTKVLNWNRGPATFSTGVSLGPESGTPLVERRMVTFTPKEPRDKSLKLVRLDVKIERSEVAIVPNAKGERPAERGTAPRHIEATVAENHGWTITSRCEPTIDGPGSAEERGGVTFTQRCQILMKSGDDSGGVMLAVNGEGKHQFIGTFGTITTVP